MYRYRAVTSYNLNTLFISPPYAGHIDTSSTSIKGIFNNVIYT